MHHFHSNINLRSSFSILSKKIEVVIFFLFSQIEFIHILRVPACLDSELLWGIKLLSSLLSNIENFSINVYHDRFQIGWHLEIQNEFAIVLEHNVFKSLSDWDSINVIVGCQGNFAILENLKRGLALVDEQTGLDNNLSLVSNEDWFLTDMNPSGKAVILSLTLKITKLGKVSIDKDSFGNQIRLAIGDKDLPTFFLGSLIVLTIKVKTSLEAITYFLVFI